MRGAGFSHRASHATRACVRVRGAGWRCRLAPSAPLPRTWPKLCRTLQIAVDGSSKTNDVRFLLINLRGATDSRARVPFVLKTVCECEHINPSVCGEVQGRWCNNHHPFPRCATVPRRGVSCRASCETMWTRSREQASKRSTKHLLCRLSSVCGPVCACTRVCWCRRIFTCIRTYVSVIGTGTDTATRHRRFFFYKWLIEEATQAFFTFFTQTQKHSSSR